MKQAVGQVTLAVVLSIAGALAWTVGTMDRRVAESARQLATLRGEPAPTSPDGTPRRVALMGRIPWVSDRWSELSWQKALQQYFFGGAATPTVDSASPLPTDWRLRF